MLIVVSVLPFCLFFFFNDTATTEIYTLSLHDALPISRVPRLGEDLLGLSARLLHQRTVLLEEVARLGARSEEHTSELQSHSDLVCRLLLEKKKTKRGLQAAQVKKHTL